MMFPAGKCTALAYYEANRGKTKQGAPGVATIGQPSPQNDLAFRGYPGDGLHG